MTFGQLEPGEVVVTGDDTPAASVWRYVRRMSGWRQVLLAALSILAAMLNLAPIELQRRLVDNAIIPGDGGLLIQLATLYGGVLIAHQVVKALLRVAQGWVSESAALYTRRHLTGLWERGTAGGRERSGEAVSIIGAEVDKLAGFVGAAPSNALGDTAILLGVVGYMLWVDPPVAALGLALLLPQLLFTPLLQRYLNRLMEHRLKLMRALGNALGDEEGDARATLPGGIYRNRIAITALKAGMKAVLNLLNGAAPLALLTIGGWQVIEGNTTLGVVVSFLSAFQRLADPLRALIAFYRQAAQAHVQHALIARWMSSDA